MPDETEVKLIVSKIDDLSAYVKANFKELYDKHDAVLSQQSKYQTNLAVMTSEFRTFREDVKESMKSQGERIGIIENNPGLKNSDRWKWVAAGLGLIYVAINVLEKVRGIIQ